MTTRNELPFIMTADNRTQAAFRELRNEVRGVNRFARQVAGAFGVAFATGAVRELASGVRDLIGDMDDAAKTARSLGIELEKFGQLQFAGSILGVNDQQLATLARKVQEALGEAVQRGGDGVSSENLDLAAFEALGLSVEQLRNAKPDELLLEIAEGFESVDSQLERTAIATELVGGRLGKSLLLLSSTGREGLQELLDEAKKLDPDFGDALGEQSEAISDAATRVGKAIQGRTRSLVADTLPNPEDIEALGKEVSSAIAGDVSPRIQEGLQDALSTGLTIPGILRTVTQSLVSETNPALAQTVDVAKELTEELSDTSQVLSGSIVTAAEEARSSFLDVLEAERQRKAEIEAAKEAERERQQIIRENAGLLSNVESALGAARSRTQGGSIGIDAGRGFLRANELNQAEDPQVAVLERIRDILVGNKEEQVLRAILRRIEEGALENPVFV